MKCVPVLENRYQNIKLNNKQSFILEELQEIVGKWEQQKALEALLQGGEHPQGQHYEKLELLASSQKGSDFWLSSTGYLFTPEKALELKRGGLVGVTLHLDHFDPEKHNTLQGYKHAYGWVLKAADSIRKAGLLLGLRLCISPEFTCFDPLLTYARMAKKMGVSIIQLADPAAIWQKQHRSVKLGLEQVQVLDNFTEMLNYDKEFQDWPVVSYPASLLNKLNSASDDEQSLCVDAEGKVHACPLS